MFINKYKKFDIVKDYISFLKKIKNLKLYIIKFNKNSIIKLKIFIFDYIIDSEKY